MTRLLTCRTCGAKPGQLCTARGGEDTGKQLFHPHMNREGAGTGAIGRPRSVDDEQVRIARALRDSGESVDSIARAIGVSRATIYRHLKD